MRAPSSSANQLRSDPAAPGQALRKHSHLHVPAGAWRINGLGFSLAATDEQHLLDPTCAAARQSIRGSFEVRNASLRLNLCRRQILQTHRQLCCLGALNKPSETALETH
jgi:hypothetical protein